MSRNKKVVTIAVMSLLTVALIASGYLLMRPNSSDQKSLDNNPYINKQDSVNNTQDRAEDEVSTDQDISEPPAKPRLTKSSGNVGTVPDGTTVEFVCEGTPGDSCSLELQNDTGNKVTLGTKQIVDDGHGLFFVSFVWKALPGTWSVTASATNSSGKSTSSDPQTLVVKEQ